MQATSIYSNAIPNESSKGFEYAGERYFAVKKANQLYVYKNACPHIGVGLDWVEDQFLDASHTMIQCANHGALFVIETGLCVAGPCTGRHLITVEYELVDDEVYLSNIPKIT